MPVQVICEVCGKPFLVSPSRVAKARFCSRICKGKGEYRAKKDKMVLATHSEDARKKRSESFRVAYKEGRKQPPVPKGSKRRYYSASMKGKHHSEETKRKMIETSKRLIREGKKKVPGGWNKGKTWEEIYGPERAKELKQKLAEMGRRQGGPKHPNWKGGTTRFRRREVKRRYKDLVFQLEREKAFKRDDYTCQDCGGKPEKPIAHHIIPYRFNKDHSAENLITLCWRCHAKRDVEFQETHPELYPEARSTEFKPGQVPWNKRTAPQRV